MKGWSTRGDKIVLSADSIERTQVVARVRHAEGGLIELDDVVTMQAGEAYAVRFRVFEDQDDTVGMSIVRSVITMPGESRALVLSGAGLLPAAGELVYFGIAGSESFALVVSGIEAGQDMSCHLRLVDAAPIIDDLTDEEVIPAWSGRVGYEIDENLLQPSAPRFTSIASGVAGTSESGVVTYLLQPGSSGVSTAVFEIDHRLVGAPTWQTVTIPAANGGGRLTAYVNGNAIQMRARGRSAADVPGPYGAVVTLTIGSGDAPIPAALDAGMITVGALLGGAAVQFATSADTATTQLQIYRAMAPTVDRATDAVGEPILVEPSRSYSAPIGDATRENLLTNGNMDSGAAWTLGAGWTIGSGKATHTAGSGSAISQALAA